jgi:hypothetical protein
LLVEKRWLFSIIGWNFPNEAVSKTMHRLKCSPGASGAYFFARNSESACKQAVEKRRRGSQGNTGGGPAKQAKNGRSRGRLYEL